MFLGSAVKGSQIGIFKISYSDGTSTTFTQALSDWSASPTASGEMLARSMSAYNRSNGQTIQQSSHVYAYSFTLDSSKKIVSITLPNNRNIKLLAMDVIA